MVFPGEGFDPLVTLTTIEQEKCTTLYGVPTMFIAELEHPEFSRFNLSSLRTGIMAGAPCPIEVMRRVIDKMNMRDVTIAYGMTETSPVSFQTGMSDYGGTARVDGRPRSSAHRGEGRRSRGQGRAARRDR